MPDVVSFFLSYVLVYKYVAVFVITFIGASSLPIPSGSILMASAAFSVQGFMSLPGTIIVGILGNIAGDNFGYWLARKYGIKAMRWLKMGKLADSEKFHHINHQISNHPVLVIYSSRFFTGIAPAVNVISGLAKLRYRKYLTFEILGECTEVIFFCMIGYIFGVNWEYLNQLNKWAWLIVVGGMIITYLLWKYILKWRKRK